MDNFKRRRFIPALQRWRSARSGAAGELSWTTGTGSLVRPGEIGSQRASTGLAPCYWRALDVRGAGIELQARGGRRDVGVRVDLQDQLELFLEEAPKGARRVAMLSAGELVEYVLPGNQAELAQGGESIGQPDIDVDGR